MTAKWLNAAGQLLIQPGSSLPDIFAVPCRTSFFDQHQIGSQTFVVFLEVIRFCVYIPRPVSS